MQQSSNAGRERCRRWRSMGLAAAAAVILATSFCVALAQNKATSRSGGNGAPPRIGGIDNKRAVRNGPTARSRFTIKAGILVASIRTYHWNHGRGRTPGTIALRGDDGTLYGPWQAEGLSGSGGAPDAYWVVRPGVTLPAGRYEIVDSDPATWSTNAAAKMRGMYRIEFHVATANGGPPEAGNTGTQSVWRQVKMGEASLEVPSDWSQEEHVRDQDVRLKSPDGTYTLLAFWWFPDEPLTGYADITWTRKVTVAGRPGLLIHHRFPRHQSLQLVFDEARTDKKRLIITLEATGRDMASGFKLHDEILSRVTFGGDTRPDVTTVEAQSRQPAAPAVASLEPGEASTLPDMVRPTPMPVPPAHEILFDGRTLGARWIPHQAAGGDFKKHARFDRDRLLVDVPAGAGWGKVGLLSPDPVVWLDDFGDGAEFEVTFKIDPEATTGFVLALAQPGYGGVAGNDPGSPSLTFNWRRKNEGGSAEAQLHVNPHRQGDFTTLEGPGIAPRTVAFRLMPGAVIVKAEGLPPVYKSWEQLADGAGFRVYAYSHAAAAKAPVRFGLREIAITRTPEYRLSRQIALPKAEPLPVEVLFAGSAGPNWKPVCANAPEFARHGRFSSGTMHVEFPAGLYRWGKCGLLSTRQIIEPDERIETTPLRLTAKIDPKRSTGLQIVFSGRQEPDMWNRRNGSFSLIRHSKGLHKGRYVMTIERSPYQTWSRALDADWIERIWDGTLQIDIARHDTTFSIAGGPSIRAPALSPYGFMTVMAHPEDRDGGAALVLERLSLGWAEPQGMTERDRWSLLDNAAFEPNAFLAAARAEVARRLAGFDKEWPGEKK